jgi:hypothetical protein
MQYAAEHFLVAIGFRCATCLHLCLVQVAGGSYFSRVAQEDNQAWVYVLSNTAGAPTHILAWRPIPVAAVEDPASDQTSVTFDAGLVSSAASAVLLSGALPNGVGAATLPIISGSSWTMKLGGIPTLVTLQL